MKKPTLDEIFAKKEVDKDKEVKLEKNDFLALCIAAASVFVPVLLIFIGAVALFIVAFLAWVK